MDTFRNLFSQPSLYEPPASYASYSTEILGQHYVFRGWGKDRTSTSINVFDSYTEIWSLKKTTGTPPSGLCDGACTSLGTDIYTFGGNDGKFLFNDLQKFDTTTNVWSEAHPKNDSKESPIRKYGCRLVSLDERTLVCFGGYGIGPTQPGSTFTRSTRLSDGRGWTNEVHLFDVGEGIWSSPVINGVRPPPCSDFTFTKVDQHRAVIFGGYQPGYVRVNDLYLLDFRNMEFTKVEPVQGEPWPVERSGHAACCLNYGEGHPKLLMSGGRDNDGKVVGDMWILDVDRGKGEMVTLPELVKPRYYHSTTATSLRPGLTEVLMFGGCLQWPKNFRTLDDLTPVAETTILRFESPDPSPSVVGSSTGEWALVGVANNTDRASNERIREKMIKIGQATRRPISVREISAESQSLRDCLHSSQDRVRSLEQQLLAAELRVQDVKQRAAEVSRREKDTQRLLQEANHRCEDVERQSIEVGNRLDESLQVSQAAEQRAMEAERRIQELTRDIDRLQGDLQQMERRAQTAEQRARSLETQWVVSRREIQLTERVVGGGGWGEVKVAKFRGIEVAAKSLYEQIRSDYYRHLFIREMNMAARLRHPNLVQFIGATLDREMVILTELMHNSLRRVLEQGGISREHTVSISMQVCQALNYLHLMQPDPVIHRDISSANVLLDPLPNNCWRAKITDYGSVNTMRSLQTENPGNPVYAAPEARTPSLQSTKMDIFSFGVLLIEMCTGQFPSDDGRERLLFTIQDREFSDVIRRCIDHEIDNRPTALQLLSDLRHF